MHIAAADPKYLRREEVPADILEKERDIARERARNEGNPKRFSTRLWKAAWPSSTKRSACSNSLS